MGNDVRVTIEYPRGTREMSGDAAMALTISDGNLYISIGGTYSGFDLLCMLKLASSSTARRLFSMGMTRESVTDLITTAVSDGIKHAERKLDLNSKSEIADDLGVEGPDGER